MKDNLLRSCEEYDSDKDPNGARGMALAQRVYQKRGKFDIGKLIEERDQWTKFGNIAFRKFPPLFGGETILVGEFKQRFSELRKAGYDIKPYSKLTKKEARNYFREIQRDITSHINNLEKI